MSSNKQQQQAYEAQQNEKKEHLGKTANSGMSSKFLETVSTKTDNLSQYIGDKTQSLSQDASIKADKITNILPKGLEKNLSVTQKVEPKNEQKQSKKFSFRISSDKNNDSVDQESPLTQDLSELTENTLTLCSKADGPTPAQAVDYELNKVQEIQQTLEQEEAYKSQQALGM